MLAFSGVGYSSAALIREFKYQDGLLTIKGSQVPTLALLEKISESTSTVIYVFDPIYSQKVHVELEEKTLQDTLRNILRGISYAVVYRAESHAIKSPSEPSERKESNGKVIIIDPSKTRVSVASNSRFQAEGRTQPSPEYTRRGTSVRESNVPGRRVQRFGTPATRNGFGGANRETAPIASTNTAPAFLTCSA